MKTISQVGRASIRETSDSAVMIDTTFVLFFLALELGQTLSAFALDGVFLVLTLLVVIAAPYFLLGSEKPNFTRWAMGRVLIAGFAVALGVMFKQSLGFILPEAFRFLPMTLLIVAAMLSCYIQFYGFLKLRLAK